MQTIVTAYRVQFKRDCKTFPRKLTNKFFAYIIFIRFLSVCSRIYIETILSNQRLCYTYITIFLSRVSLFRKDFYVLCIFSFRFRKISYTINRNF